MRPSHLPLLIHSFQSSVFDNPCQMANLSTVHQLQSSLLSLVSFFSPAGLFDAVFNTPY
jgi:hypothetical protein